jgi:hypothetical protein
MASYTHAASQPDLSRLDWEQSAVRATIDGALSRLRAQDRRAILLRFYEHLTFLQVGQALGIDEEAARKRVVRAVAKLRGLLSRQGGVVTSVGLATVLSTRLVEAAPIGFAQRVATTALEHATAALTAGSGAAAVSADATTHLPSFSIARTVERQISMLKLRLFAAYALSAAVFFGACSVLVHKLIFHDRGGSQPSSHVHRD